MKNLILVAITLLSQSMYSQIPTVVNDPAANASLTKAIANGATQIQQADRSISLLEGQKERLDRINGALRSVEYISEMSVLSEKIISETMTTLRSLEQLNTFNAKEMGTITNNFQKILNKGNGIFRSVNDLLQGGLFQMNDAERLTLLKTEKSSLQEVLMDVRIYEEKYNRIAKNRAMKNLFKKQ